MLHSFWIVFGQTLSLFLMIAVGFGMYKAKRITDAGAAQMTDLLLYAVTPCVVFNAFNRPFDPGTARSIAVFSGVSAAFLLLTILIGRLVYRKGEKDTLVVQRFASAFSNCGFMGIPLAGAVCGEMGTLYASIFVVLFNLFQWTYGLAMMSGERFSVKKAIINPCVLGLLAGLPVFLLSVNVPAPVENAVSMMAALNSPLAMIVIGTHLAKADLVSTLKDTRCYFASALRLIVMPAAVMPLIIAVPWLNHDQTITLAVMFGAPVAASCALFATKFRRDSTLASRMVAMSTLFSIATLPVLVSVVKTVIE
jgi:Predicted permeases